MFVKRNAFYRIVVISICFLLVGISLFIPLAGQIEENPVLFYSILGVFLFLYVGCCVGNELYIRFRYKGKDEDE